MAIGDAGPNSIQHAANTISNLIQQAPEMVSGQDTIDVAPEPQTDTSTETLEPTKESLAPEAPSGETEGPRLYEVKYGDEVRSLTEEELISGNMMQADYTRKTMALSEKQKAIDEHEAKVSAQLSELETLVLSEAQDFNSPEMLALREDDPAEYLERFEKVKVKADTLNRMKAEQEQKQTQSRNEKLAKEQELMIQAIPEWLDPAKLQGQWQDLSVYLNGQGQDINSITNHKDIVNARKAMLFDRIQSQDIEAKKVNKAPKSTTPEAPTKPEITSAQQQRLEILAKSGRRQDAQAVIKDILNR